MRHGESEPLVEGNPFPLVDGHGDPALAPEGQAQAELVGERLAAEPIAAIYVTTLRRTHQTAAPLAARLGLAPIVEPDLREVHLGRLGGRAVPPEGRRRRSDRGADVHRAAVGRHPGAEQAEAFADRVTGRDLPHRRGPPRPAGGRVVAHGGVIGEVLAQATGSRPWAFVGADNGSISRLVVSPDRWILRGFNDTVHLDPTFFRSS